MSEFVSCKETAKLIRAALQKAFPRIKFSVRCHQYSGGASINIEWTDGPTARMVEAVTDAYAGGGFDGMIDMAYSKYSWLSPDGSAVRAKIKGTTGSAGSVESEQYMQPSFRARLVRFGADYVFTKRKYSEGFYRRAADTVARQTGEAIAVKVSSYYGTPMVETDRQLDGQRISDLVHNAVARRVGVGV